MTATAQPRRRLRAADVICLGGIVVGSIFYLVMIPVIPSLVATHPVLLEFLGGSLAAQITAGAFARVGRTSLALALAAPVIGTSAFDPFWWWAGRRYGKSLLHRLTASNPRSAKGAERTLRLFNRFGGWTLVFAYYLPVPTNLLYAAAGWSGFSFLRFILLDLTGALLRIGLNVGLGYALGASAEHAAGAISHYSLIATVALIVIIVAVTMWRSRPYIDAPEAEPGGDPAAGDEPTAVPEPAQATERSRPDGGPASPAA